MRITRTSSTGMLAIRPSVAAYSQSLPFANRPEDVDSGRMPGAVLLIARKGKIATLYTAGF